MSIRWVLTDKQWAKMEPHCLGKPSDPGRSSSDNRRFVEAVLWIARSASMRIMAAPLAQQSQSRNQAPHSAAADAGHCRITLLAPRRSSSRMGSTVTATELRLAVGIATDTKPAASR